MGNPHWLTYSAGKRAEHTMTKLKPIDLAHYYLVNDLPGAHIHATRLYNILDSLQKGHPPTLYALSYLQKQGLVALSLFAQAKMTYEAFRDAAAVEQAERKPALEAELLARRAAEMAREAAWEAECERERRKAEEAQLRYESECRKVEEARRIRESDPKYIAARKARQLLKRYGLDGYIEKPCLPRLMAILQRANEGHRLTDDDVVWLTTDGKVYYSETLRMQFHAREAEFHSAEYKRTGDPWSAVNASSHYRKSKQAKHAHALLITIPTEQQKTSKLKSAIRTTHGGALRDMQRWDEAIALGTEAHTLTPKDFRPCTLLGAVNFELGNYDLAKAWYDKAVERGASEKTIDHDLRGIFERADKAKREEIRAVLLREDPVRYGWVDTLRKGKSTARTR